MFYGWYIVFATFVMLFAAFGVLYSFSAFFLPLSAEFAASRAAVSFVFSSAVFLLFLSGAVSGAIADRTNPKFVLTLGVIALTAGLIGAAHADTIVPFALRFAIGAGIGVGFVYVPSVTTVQRWFHRKRGLASGIAVTGIGVGTLLTPLAVGYLLSSMSWRAVFVGMAIFVACAGAIAVFFIEAQPADRGLPPDGMPHRDHTAETAQPDMPLSAILRSKPFVLYYVAQAVLAVPIFVALAHLVPFAEDAGLTKTQSVTVFGLIGFGSTIGRFLIGGYADRVGRRRSVTALFAGIALAYIVWTFAQSHVGLSIFAACFGVCYGGYVALSPALIADYFSGPKLSTVMGAQYTAGAFGSLGGPVLAGFLFDRYASYAGALWIGVGCSALAFLLVAIMPEPGFK